MPPNTMFLIFSTVKGDSITRSNPAYFALSSTSLFTSPEYATIRGAVNISLIMLSNEADTD